MAMSLSSSTFWNRATPYAAVIFMQFGLAGMALIAKHALNQGLNHYSFVVYRHIVAFAVIAPFALVLERKVRPKMTSRIFAKILLLALLEPVMDQNLYYMGMKYSSATFVAALSNVLPALTFIMAWIFRLEKVNIKRIRSQAKIAGTVVTIGGAMVMTLVKGPIIPTPWNDSGNGGGHGTTSATADDPIKGAIMIAGGCTCWASFVILQAVTVKSYPAELSLTALMCSLGAMLGLVLALVMERGNSAIWSIHLDSKLLAVVYSGIICSGIGYYLQAVIMKTKGPVFVTAFSPLTMVIVAILSSFILSETLSFGRLVGALVIVTGLYLVIWGKSKDTQQASATNESIDELMIIPIQAQKDLKNILVDKVTANEKSVDCTSNLNIIVREEKRNPNMPQLATDVVFTKCRQVSRPISESKNLIDHFHAIEITRYYTLGYEDQISYLNNHQFKDKNTLTKLVLLDHEEKGLVILGLYKAGRKLAIWKSSAKDRSLLRYKTHGDYMHDIYSCGGELFVKTKRGILRAIDQKYLQ